MPPTEPEVAPQHLVFTAGGRDYGVPAMQAAEVVLFKALTEVPGAPPHLLGIFSHRGEIIPAVDFSQLAGGQACRSQRAVLLRIDSGAVALTVDDVHGVMDIAGPPPPRRGETGIDAHLFGPADAGGRTVTLIAPDGLFSVLNLVR